LKGYYISKYNENAIQLYWENECTPVGKRWQVKHVPHVEKYAPMEKARDLTNGGFHNGGTEPGGWSGRMPSTMPSENPSKKRRRRGEAFNSQAWVPGSQKYLIFVDLAFTGEQLAQIPLQPSDKVGKLSYFALTPRERAAFDPDARFLDALEKSETCSLSQAEQKIFGLGDYLKMPNIKLVVGDQLLNPFSSIESCGIHDKGHVQAIKCHAESLEDSEGVCGIISRLYSNWLWL
jgi:hypothetical protein